MSDLQLEALPRLFTQMSGQFPFTEFLDFRREAQTQLHLLGNWRMALAATAAAGEILVNTILLHLLWEERVPPEEAALYFSRREGHVRRVTSRFAPRLGGNWADDGSSVPGRYVRAVTALRNRVLHAGHETTETEARRALEALVAFEKFLGDRLASERALPQYPRTAYVYCGENGLKSRGRLVKAVVAVAHDPNEPPWDITFDAYRRLVDRELDPEAPDPGHDPGELTLIYERYRSGQSHWFIVDATIGLAAPVDPLSVIDQAAIDFCEGSVDEQADEDLPDPVRTRVLFTPEDDWDATSLTWLPLHRVSPSQPIFPGPWEPPGAESSTD